MPVCGRCKVDKEPTEFGNFKRGRDGLSSRCKECCAEVSREKNLMKNYGLSSADYSRMFKEQGGVCKVCGKPESAKRRSLAVDHCHSSGKIRGLLCQGCNVSLGRFNDDIALLKNAIRYLEENS